MRRLRRLGFAAIYAPVGFDAGLRLRLRLTTLFLAGDLRLFRLGFAAAIVGFLRRTLLRLIKRPDLALGLERPTFLRFRFVRVRDLRLEGLINQSMMF